MPLSKEVRLLESKWKSGQGWPKRLEWIEIGGIRGWIGQRIEFQFPIVALVGENGVEMCIRDRLALRIGHG